jgi:putative ABC transport system permease protein
MSLLNLALAYLWRRRLASALTALSVALGVALVLVVISVRGEIERTFIAQGRGYDYVVGAPGSEAALVLSTLFHADAPRGNLPYETYERIRQRPGVTAAFPVALGDQARGARIVGVTREFLKQQRTDGSPLFPMATGRIMEKNFELVAGATAARRLGLKLGDEVIGAHAAAAGFVEHRGTPYVVVGVLAPTGTPHDRALFTTLESYWEIHAPAAPGAKTAEELAAQERGNVPVPAGKREVTAILLRATRNALLPMRAQLAAEHGVMAVRPSEVLTGVLEQVLSPLERLLLLYGGAVIIVAAISIMTTLYLATLARRRDLGILRALGALPIEIFALVLLEGLALVTIGCGTGVLMSQLASWFARGELSGRFGLDFETFAFTPCQALAVLAVMALSVLGSLLPAVEAYRGDVARRLGRG